MTFLSSQWFGYRKPRSSSRSGRRRARLETLEKRNLLAAEVLLAPLEAPWASILEEEANGGSANDTSGEAQSLESSFVRLEGERAAVQGSLTGDVPATLQQSETVVGPGIAYPNVFAFEFDGRPSIGDATLVIDATLDIGFPSEYLQVSIEGLQNQIIFDGRSPTGGLYPDFLPRQETIRVPASVLQAAADDGVIEVSVTPNFQVNNFRGFDQELTVTLSYETAQTSDSVDHYSFELLAGQPLSLALAGSGNPSVDLVDAQGNVLTPGQSNATDVESFVRDYVAPIGGTYFARVTGSDASDYTLQVAREASLAIDEVVAGETVQLLVNGDFETGTLDGWTATADFNRGSFVVNNGAFNPNGPLGPVAPISGNFDALVDSRGPDTRTLSQAFIVPQDVSSATLRWSDRIFNYAANQGFVDPLQEFRVSLATPQGEPIAEIFSTNPGDALQQPGPNERSFDLTSTLSSLAGQTVVLEFTEQDLYYFFNVALDDISLEVTTGVPVIQNIDTTNTVWGDLRASEGQSGYGVAVDNISKHVSIFDTETNTVTAVVPIPSSGLLGDVEIDPQRELAFVTDFNRLIWVIDLSGTPSLGNQGNPIQIATAAEDLAFSPDGNYLLVTDGNGAQPISVIDVNTLTQVSTFDPASDHTSIDVGDDGSVLVTSGPGRTVRRFTIDGTGTLENTGEILRLSGGAPNVYFAPGNQTGVAIQFRTITSFDVHGLRQADSFTTPRRMNMQSAVFSPDGTRLYVRSDGSNNQGFIDVFGFDPITGQISDTPLQTISGIDNDYAGPLPERLPVYFGMEQIALSEDGSQLYVTQANSIDVFDAFDGTLLDSITHPTIVHGTGIKLMPGTDPVNEVDEYTFTVNQVGAVIEIHTLLPGGTDNPLDPVITLVNPSGEIMATDDNDFDGTNALLSFTPDTPGVYTVRVAAAGSVGGEYVLHVNHSPILTSVARSAGVDAPAATASPITVEATFGDRNLDDIHSATIDWGDGSGPQSVSVAGARGGGRLVGEHTYSSGGIYTVVVTVTDDNGLSDSAVTSVVVSGIGVFGNQLQIIGTASDDHVHVNLVGGKKNPQLRIHSNFASGDGQGRSGFVDVDAGSIDEILIVLGDGDDRATIAGNISIDAIIFGGDGNDHLSSAAGNDILSGGPGEDQLLSGKGLDVLSGGFGLDKANGQSGDDFLTEADLDGDASDDADAIADLLSDLALLRDIRQTWIQADSTDANERRGRR